MSDDYEKVLEQVAALQAKASHLLKKLRMAQIKVTLTDDADNMTPEEERELARLLKEEANEPVPEEGIERDDVGTLMSELARATFTIHGGHKNMATGEWDTLYVEVLGHEYVLNVPLSEATPRYLLKRKER